MMDNTQDKEHWLKFYFNALTSDLGFLPIYYKKDDYYRLYYSMFRNVIDDRNDQINEEFSQIAKIAEFKKYKLEQYKYFRAIENLKNMEVTFKYGSETVLCPIGDSIAYSNRPNVAYRYNDDSAKLEFFTVVPVKKGEAFSLNYGVNSQFKRLMAYGITEPVFRDEQHYFQLYQVISGGKEVNIWLNWNFEFGDIMLQLKNDDDFKVETENEQKTVDLLISVMALQFENYDIKEIENKLLQNNLTKNEVNIFRILKEEYLVGK